MINENRAALSCSRTPCSSPLLAIAALTIGANLITDGICGPRSATPAPPA